MYGRRASFLDTGRDRFSHHLEISEHHTQGRLLLIRVLFRRRHEQLSAGRHGHQDDTCRKRHAKPNRQQGNLRRTQPEQLSRSRQNAAGSRSARNFSQCDSLLIGSLCGAHTFPDVRSDNATAVVEHEATTSKINEDQLFYCNQRGIGPEDAVGLIVNGYAREVLSKLPMEFAVEAQKLLQVSLEGSVG